MNTSQKVIVLVSVIVSVVVVTDWLVDESLSPNACEMAAMISALQVKANKQWDSLAMDVLNRLAGIGGLEPVTFSLALTCPAPSTALRFMPLVGKALLIVRFREYVTCMEKHLVRRKIFLLSWISLVSTAGCFVVVFLWMLVRHEPLERVGEQKEATSQVTNGSQQTEVILSPSGEAEKSFHEDGDAGRVGSEDEEESDNAEELLRRVPFITEQQMRELAPGRLLGRGCFGAVRQVVYKGTKAVVKEFLDTKALLPLLREACLMLKLQGAGGVPCVLALCPDPPAVVQEFVGETYDRYLRRCSVGGFLDSLLSISHRLKEIHALGIVHNDLKVNNITFTGSISEPVFHLIDLGWACREGDVADHELKPKSARAVRTTRRNANQPVYKDTTGDDYSSYDTDDTYDEFEYDGDADDSEYYEWRWMAPEVRVGQRVWPSGDVYSLGILVDGVLLGCQEAFLTVPMLRLAKQCTTWDPSLRPDLTHVVEVIGAFKSTLLPRQLTQRFRYKG